MAGSNLLARVSDFPLVVFTSNYSGRIIFHETIEEYYTKKGIREKWRVKIAKDLGIGCSYWCYLGRVE